MSRRKTYEFESNPDVGEDPDLENEHAEETHEPAPYSDPNEEYDYVVMTDGAVFSKDRFAMKKADVPEPEPKGDMVTCHVGDVVRLTPTEAAAKRASGVALAERPPKKEEQAA